MGLCKGGGRELDGSPAAGSRGWELPPLGRREGAAPSAPRHRQQQSLLFACELDVTLVLGFYSFGVLLMSRRRATRKTYKEIFFKVAEGKRRVYVTVYANSY